MHRVDRDTIRAAAESARAAGVDRDPYGLLLWAHDVFQDGLMMTTAFGKSGMVILHMVKDILPELPVYFLDTGYHFPETLEFFEDIKARWKVRLILKRPRLHGQAFERVYGERLYERDPDRCCHHQKTESLAELFGAHGKHQAWITGVRRDQSSTRAHSETIEILEGDLAKVQPLAYWTREDVARYLEKHDVPLHPLFARGYTSIGCAPCTAPNSDAGDERGGRWKGRRKTECGLHVRKSWVKTPASAGEEPAPQPRSRPQCGQVRGVASTPFTCR